ncbi:MAG: hypothetical protein FJ403_19150 [Verrucomicrobia bacterium]|nr:hypothetical protein [Verrucomicrobiota bacterium]
MIDFNVNSETLVRWDRVREGWNLRRLKKSGASQGKIVLKGLAPREARAPKPSTLTCLGRSQAEIYAREQIYLHERPTAELKLQALQIGNLSIAAIGRPRTHLRRQLQE